MAIVGKTINIIVIDALIVLMIKQALGKGEFRGLIPDEGALLIFIEYFSSQNCQNQKS